MSEQSTAIISKLEHHPLFEQSRRVLLFHSLPDEVNTHQLIEQYKNTKQILLPTVVDDHLELHVYDKNAQLTEGAFSISESLGELYTDYDSIDLAIIPGMAFDKEGNRIGRGKGYYDRLLPYLTCHTIGICFPHQFLPSVPHEDHDMKVDEILTL